VTYMPSIMNAPCAKLTMRHHAEDEREAHADQRIERAGQQAVNRCLEAG